MKEIKTRGMRWQTLLMWAIISGMLGSVASCAMTRVEGKHPLLQASGVAGSARVYFLRRPTERNMGFADNPVTVDMNEAKLMDLAKGEYTAVSLVPRDYQLVLRNLTEVGPDWRPKELLKRYRFDFQEGRTYFVAITAVDGEFRGVFFDAQLIDLSEARQVARRLRPVHGAAPVESLNPSTTIFGEGAPG